MQEAVCLEQQLDLFTICGVPVEGNTPVGSFGRTCPEPSRLTRDWIFNACLKKSERPKFQCLKMADGQMRDWLNCQSVTSHGEYWMLNIGESPNVEEESFLSWILQPSEDVPDKYYLSGRACRGILRRAEQRGKELPPELKAALEEQASCGCEPDARGGGKGALVSRERSLTLAANTNDQVLFVPDKARSLTARNDGSPCLDRGPDVIAVYDMTHADEVMRRVPDGRAPTLNARMGTGGNQVPVVSYAIAGNTIDRQLQNGGNGKGVLEEKSYTLNTVDRHAVAAFAETSFGAFRKDTVAGTLKASGGGIGGGSESIVCQKTVRRLTPIEAERLQGLPDNYTLIDDKSCSDTARYKALGNGMAQPNADYVIKRIVEVVGNDS